VILRLRKGRASLAIASLRMTIAFDDLPTAMKNRSLKIDDRQILYNGLVPETKPFRLTESVKAAG
jgi:hypothetical protein